MWAFALVCLVSGLTEKGLEETQYLGVWNYMVFKVPSILSHSVFVVSGMNHLHISLIKEPSNPLILASAHE